MNSILFIDDNPRNIEGARTAGLHAEHWDFTQGHPTLHAILSNHGISTTS